MDGPTLRHNRLVFYEGLVRDVNRVIREFLKLSGAKCAFLIDREGHMVTRQGVTQDIDVDTISALVAGSFAATKEMARLLGEEEFSVLFHQGKTDSIQVSLVGDRTLLTVIFDDSTTVGMVRLYASQTSQRLTELFERQEERRAGSEPLADEQADLDDGFVGSAKDKLDDLFGG
jgi:predicted regulator of Ras-like GTPase activity (Roadblock/LC7/MglB family)